MAKLLVKIDIPTIAAAELLRQLAASRDDLEGTAPGTGWFSEQDADRVLVDSAYLETSLADDSFYTFELVGVSE